MSTFFSSRRGVALLLAIYILFSVGCAWAVWREANFRQFLPVMDAIGQSDSIKTRACVINVTRNPQGIWMEIVNENAAFYPEFQRWVALQSPPSLSRSYASIQYTDANLRFPERGDIMDFVARTLQESSPGTYSRLSGIEIIGKASDELLAVCDAEWDRYRTQ